MCQGNGVQDSGFRGQGLGFRVQGLGFRFQGLGFKFQGLGFKVQGLPRSLPWMTSVRNACAMLRLFKV